MLTKLTIERFKSIRTSSLELGRVNLFIGGNGAGKSNVLEAIGVVAAALERGVSDQDLSRKGVRITPPELMKSAFKFFDLPKTLQITAQMENEVQYRINLTGRRDDPLLSFFSEKCSYGSQDIFGRSYRGSSVLGESIQGRLNRHRSIWDQVRTAFEFPISVDNALHGLSEYAIFSPQTDFLRGVQAGKVNTPPIGLRGEGLPEAVRGLIRQVNLSRLSYFRFSRLSHPSRPHRAKERRIAKSKYELKRKALDLAYLPQWARTVRVGNLDEYMTSRDILERGKDMVYFIDKYMHSKRNTLSAYDSSEGTLFLLFAGVLLSHDESPKTFALDNVDSALNPGMTRKLLETVIEITNTACEEASDVGPRQVFLTSHNPSSLDAFDLFDDHQRVFVVERNDDGHSEIERLVPKQGMSREDWYEAANGRSLSQLWLDGWIRGALGESV